MAECTKMDLRKAREARKLARWELAQMMGVSEDTIERWENAKDTSTPTPDDVDRMGELLEDPTLWHRWMLSNVESYRKRYFDATDLSLPVSLQRLGYEIQDVMILHDKAVRDALDGRIDDPLLLEEYKKEMREMIAAASDSLSKL